MIRFIRDFRLIPIVLIASLSLFALKVIGILADGGYTLGAGHMAKSGRASLAAARLASNEALIRPPAVSEPETRPAAPPTDRSWAQQMFSYPDVTGSVGSAGSAGSAKPKDASTGKADDKKDKPQAGKPGDQKSANPKPANAKPADPKPVEPRADPGGKVVPVDGKPMSPAERAILERLQDRRQELDERARELDMRETLLQASEQQIEARMKELKETEARIGLAMAKKEEEELARFKNLVGMYESMKAKDAAKVFDRLDIKVLTEMVGRMNPRRMSDILGQMSPEAAERLTLELASRAKTADQGTRPTELPKIEGKPSGG